MSAILFSEYIQIIMTLEEAVQHVVMTAIQEVSPYYCRVCAPRRLKILFRIFVLEEFVQKSWHCYGIKICFKIPPLY